MEMSNHFRSGKFPAALLVPKISKGHAEFFLGNIPCRLILEAPEVRVLLYG